MNSPALFFFLLSALAADAADGKPGLPYGIAAKPY